MTELFDKTSVGKKIFTLSFLLLFFNLLSFAQSRTLKGSVRDQDNRPVEGATITVKESKNSTAADKEGNYSITAVEGQTILVSSVNFQSQEFVLGSSDNIDIILERQTGNLNDVVVIGYGTQKKLNVSGAITTVSSKNISMSPASNLGAGLAGRVSGVVINNRGGEPGNDNVEIFIRGKNTTGDASPLYVIDGIVRDYGALSFLPPSEIESITVLKDASAAIYGSRAANGVILVTTKRGKAGKAIVTVAFNQAILQPERIQKVVDAATYAEMSNLQLRIKGLPEQYTAEDIELYRNGKDPLNHPNTDWSKLAYKEWNHQQRGDISVSGGNDDVKYFVAAGLLNTGSPFKEGFSYDKQYHFRSNIDAQITKSFRVSLDLSGRYRDNLMTQANYPFLDIFAIPTLNGIYPNGLIGPQRGGQNVLTALRDSDYGSLKSRALNYMSLLSAEYKISAIDGLSLQGNLAFDYDNNFRKTWGGITYYYVLNPITGEYDPFQSTNTAQPFLNETFPSSNSLTSNLKLNYSKIFGSIHNLDAFVGFEQNRTISRVISAGRTNYASGSIQELFAGDANKANQSNDGSSAETGRQNLFGRALYTYADRYTLQFQFRYDGSQNFPVGNRYGFFPGISAAWNISKEKFFSNVQSVDYLKIRGSYGELGNDKIGPYQYLTSYTYGSNYAFNGVTNQGLVQTNVPNTNITWEVAKTVDVGIEGALLNGLLTAEIDYFRTVRSDILAQRNASVPTYTGLTLPAENIGKTKNQGIEIILSHFKPVSKDFSYNVETNFTYAKNTVVFVDELPNLPIYQKGEGKPIGAPLLYETIGVFNDDEEIAKLPHRADNVPGDLIFKDQNGDGEINALDQVRQKYSSSPQIIYGLNFRINYKQFTLFLGFQGQGKAIVERTSIVPFDPIGWGVFPRIYAQDVWTPENPDGTMPAPGQTFDRGGSFTTFNWVDASFLKLKTAELGYTLSPKLLNRVGAKGARVYISGTNLFFLFDKLRHTNVSPELTNWGWGMAQQRIVNAGFNISF